MPYTPAALIQTDPPPSTFQQVRDLLGVDLTALPDAYLAGLPEQRVLARANRQCPGWATRGQTVWDDFDSGVVEALAVEAIARLKTLYAKGEQSFAERSGDYAWDQRCQELDARAAADFSRTRALIAALLDTSAVRSPLRVYGPSKAASYTSPFPLAEPARLCNPWGVRGNLLP